MSYVVKKGDTFSEIARDLGVNVNDLMLLNPYDPRNLPIGAVLVLPGEEEGSSAVTSEVSPLPSSTTEPAVRDDVEWQRVAFKFEQVFGYPPTVNADIDKILRDIRNVDPEWVKAAYQFIDFFGFVPSGGATAAKILRDVRSNLPETPTDPSPTIPDSPAGGEDVVVEAAPVDWKSRVRALYPYLPDELIQTFADFWADSGDPTLALAEMRASPSYDTFFPGNRRSDGSLRHTETEYFATREAYRDLYRGYGLNPDIFEDRFVELIENNQSPLEHASRLGAAYEQVIGNIPQVREAFAQFGNIGLSDQAIFASIIDPTVGEAIINRRISVAQVAGEGLARGFDVDQPFAQRLAFADVNQLQARQFFSSAEDQLPTLDTLARRFRDPDSDFDIDEFAQATIEGSAGQGRRIRRLLAAEQSLFTDQLGGTASTESLALTGLRPR